MTELEKAIRHIKTRADAWAVTEVTEALQSISERMDKALSQEPCDKCKYFDGNSCHHYDYKVGYTQGYEDASNRFRQEPCDDAISLTKEAYSDLCLRASKADDLQRALDMEKGAYNALVKNIQCDDAIGRKDAIIQISWDFPTLKLPKIKESLGKLPSVTQKYGKWIHFAQSDDCSECGWSTGKYGSPSKYCPNCGAKMESEE